MQKVARYTVLAALFIIPFLSLYVSNSLFFPFITGKGFAFRILVEIAVFAWLALAAADKKYRPQFSWTLALYGALAVWMLIADALAVSPLKAFWSNFERMDGWITLIHAFLFFVVAGAVLTADKLWRNWWLAFLAASALVSFYGLFQLFGIFQIHQGGVRLDATLGNAAYLAAYLLFGIAIALWQGIESKGWLRYALWVLAVLEAIVLFYTATRGALLGFLGALFLGGILWMLESGKQGRRNAAILLAALIVLVGGFYFARHADFVQHSPTLSRFSDISLADGQVRFTIWHMALEGFAARPVTGWGQEGFNYVFNTYYVPSMYTQEPWFDRAHNVFFDWLTAGGLPALLLFLALLASAVVALYRGSATRAERVILIGALATYAFQGLFVFDNLFSYIPLAAILAMAHAAKMRPIRQLEAVPELDSSAHMTAGIIALVFGAVVIWFVNVPNISAARDLIKALSPQAGLDDNLTYFKKAIGDGSFANQEIREQLATFASTMAASTAVADANKAEVISYAVSQMGLEAKERPKDARIYLEYALTYRAAGDIPDALAQTTAALALSPNKQQILLEAGLEEWQTGNLEKANEYFSKAYALYPASNDLAVAAAAGDILTDNTAAGQELLLSHFGTTTVDNDLLVYAYYGAKRYTDLVTTLRYRLAQNDTAENAYQLASAYVVIGRTDLARALIQATMTAHPETAAEGRQLLSALNGQ